ncbi:MAG: acetate kinase [Elusimicrobiaceae bacterium]|nr:acetate kinase [Elusimicrobiaceae bacterium]
MRILCLNCGSSSLKYLLYDWQKKTTLASGLVERVTGTGSFIKHSMPGREEVIINKDCPTHQTAIQLVMDTLIHPQHGVIKSPEEVSAVGHRVVHGGEKFTKSVIITDEVFARICETSDLAPLHNPPNIMGIESARKVMPDAPHMAIMDTAWHQTMPQHSYLYAVPYKWYEKYGIRRYGFHGTSFLYTAKRAAVLLGKNPFECNLIICHIGNGASINAVKNGVSVDTSMGLTPLEGLIMGTRSGDMDPAIGYYIMDKEGCSGAEMLNILNKKCGVLGITEKYVDRRDIEDKAEKGDVRCKLAIEMEGYRMKKYIGAYAAALGRVDAVVFTAGVGEMGAPIREEALKGLEFMGLKFDAGRNNAAMTRNCESRISADGSAVQAFVIPTDEEIVFVEDVVGLLENRYDEHTRFEYTFQRPDYRNSLRDEEFKRQLKKKPWLLKAAVNLPDGITA